MSDATRGLRGPRLPRPRLRLLRWFFGDEEPVLRQPVLPTTIGRYRVVRKLGEGGMGTVFEAEDEMLGRRVAIKRLKAVDESARRRFWREARAVARLSHPNVCALYEVGEDASGPFLAMELLVGEPLSERLRRGTGKTALGGELLRRVRSGSVPVTVVAGRCIERQGPGEAFLPFLDALGRLFASRGRDQAVEVVRTWAPTVGVLMQTALVPDPDGSLQRQTAGATRERLIREAGDVMEAAARLYPVVMLLEDMQYADPASVDLLVHLARRSFRQRFLLLCTCRGSELEVLNPAAAGWSLARPPDALDLEATKDVKDMVRAYLATLPPDDRELLSALSVLGKEFSSGVARALKGGDELEVEERLLRLSRVHRVLDRLGDGVSRAP